MLYTEIIAVCFKINTKPINSPCGQNVEFFCLLIPAVHKLNTGLSRVTTLSSNLKRFEYCANKLRDTESASLKFPKAQSQANSIHDA